LDEPLGPRARWLITGGCLIVVVGTGVLDRATGPHLSFAAFYLLPVAISAWWAGFAPGVLLALAGTLAWGIVDVADSTAAASGVTIWNGVTRFGTLALVASLASRLHAGVVRERRLARTDPLTGAANGRHFYEAVATAADRARELGRPLSLAYLDLDDFKQVNDRLGHAAGDEVLVRVSATIRTEAGPASLLARLGGDEFALLLPDAAPEAVKTRLTAIHQRVTAELAGRGWPVGLSIGAVTFPRPALDVDRMVQRADALMYSAKHKGKGRVEHVVAGNNAEPGSAERRALAQVVSVWTVRVREESEAGTGGEYATIRDITSECVRLSVSRKFPNGTLLIIEPMAADARALLARVTGADEERGGWAHRCSLAARLDEDDLRRWLDARQPVPQSPVLNGSVLGSVMARV
jgi:diguanylate cyclase (GGDEF)-like protein